MKLPVTSQSILLYYLFKETKHSLVHVYHWLEKNINQRIYLLYRNVCQPKTKQTKHRQINMKRLSIEYGINASSKTASLKCVLKCLQMHSFQPVLHDWCNKGRGMCYHVCGMVHIKEPLLLIGKSSLCGGSGFPFSLSEWSLTICLTPYNRN